MTSKILPRTIYQFLTNKCLGQTEVLKKVSVAVYKHINGLKAGNLLFIGNSGTGKTTIMNSIQKFYQEHKELEKFSAMTIMNANMLAGDDTGEVNLVRLLRNLENSVNNTFGTFITDDKLKEYMENATVCIDEVDKITARISGKTNVSGLTIQHALLTMLEGETILYETTREDLSGERKTKVTIDTSKMLYIFGGAFEGLYDQVHEGITSGKDDRQLKKVARMGPDGAVRYTQILDLKDQLRLSDLFSYGMMPQFISRFSSIAVLEDLGVPELKQILMTADDSPLRYSHEYFQSMGIELRVTKDALDLIASHAVDNTRIGARALREVFSRIIDPLEYDPYGSGRLEQAKTGQSLTIDRTIVEESLAETAE